MEKSADVFSWTYQLQCPPTIFNNVVKKTLYSGLVGFMWDDLSDDIFNAKEAKTIRKNVLLHRLKQDKPNKVIQCIRNILHLKLNKNNIKKQISKLEKEYEEQDFAVRQKVQKVRDISSKHSEKRARRDLLKMKYNQTNTQLHDCDDMRLVCQHLMPGVCKDMDHKILMEMSNVVTSLWTGANKRQVWDIISSNLDHIEIPTLWHHLYQCLTKAVDTLTESQIMKPIDSDNININIGITKIYGQHISIVSKRLLYNAKANNHQRNVMEFIEKTETASNNSVHISEWLALALEVYKLEIEQKYLKKKVEKIQNDLHENNILATDLTELNLEIQNTRAEIAKYIQEIQQSLQILKSAPIFITKTKEKINLELQKIIMMRTDGYDTEMLKSNLTTELHIFHNTLDLNALRKVMLKGEIGMYRYTKSCFSEASIPITNSQLSNITLYFPWIQTPIYFLIECYKNLISMLLYKKFETLEAENNEENTNLFHLPALTYNGNNYNTIDLLKLSKISNTKTRTEIDEFNEILNAWVNQPVQKVMEIIEKTVDDVSFSEWIERYDLLLYTLHNSTLYYVHK